MAKRWKWTRERYERARRLERHIGSLLNLPDEPPELVRRFRDLMRRVEFWRWMIPGNTGKLHRSRFDMTAEEAQARYPGCQRVPGTCVVRDLPETEEEVLRRHTGSFLGPERFNASATPPPAPDAEPGSPPPPAPEPQ